MSLLACVLARSFALGPCSRPCVRNGANLFVLIARVDHLPRSIIDAATKGLTGAERGTTPQAGDTFAPKYPIHTNGGSKCQRRTTRTPSSGATKPFPLVTWKP